MNKTIPAITASELRHRLRAASNCDALTTEKAWLRTFVYVENWRPDVDVVKYDNGGGDHAFVLFLQDGRALIKGFDHNSEASPHAREVFATWPGMYEGVPEDLLALLTEEIFESAEATFCCWSQDGTSWNTGSAEFPDQIEDGSSWILGALQKDAAQFVEWARAYYGGNFELIGTARINREFLAVKGSI